MVSPAVVVAAWLFSSGTGSPVQGLKLGGGLLGVEVEIADGNFGGSTAVGGCMVFQIADTG